MIEQQNPITPPPELVEQWECEYHHMTYGPDLSMFISEKAARWGADQQLAEDAKWLDHHALNEAHLKTIPVGDLLKEAMRPKPPSLKAQALEALKHAEEGWRPVPADCEIIRRALESLPD